MPGGDKRQRIAKDQGTGSPPRIVAAIPCFNEEAHIGDVVRLTQRFVDLVLVVDDGSNDGTARLAKEAGALVLRHSHNQGKGMALNTALETIRKLGAQAAVFLDGDGQHDPLEIPRLIEPVLKGQAQLVVGSRFLGRKNSIPRYRVLGQTVLTLASNLGSGIWLTDSQSGFRALSQEAIHGLHFSEPGLAVESEMQFQARELGLKVAEVPIHVHYQDKTRRNPAAHGFGVLFRVLALAARRYFRRSRRYPRPHP